MTNVIIPIKMHWITVTKVCVLPRLRTLASPFIPICLIKDKIKNPVTPKIIAQPTKSNIPALEEIVSGIKSDTTPNSESINIVATTMAKRTNNFLSSNVLAKSSNTLPNHTCPHKYWKEAKLMDYLICLLAIRQHWYILKYHEDCSYLSNISPR